MFGKIIDGLKLIPKYLEILSEVRINMGLIIFGLVILLTPPILLEYLGLTGIRQKILPWISIVLLLCLSLLIANLIVTLATRMKSSASRKKALHNLSQAEKEVLSKYIDEDTPTQYFTIQNGVINELVAKGILYRPSIAGYGSGRFAYNIQPWAWNYLREHPELLK